jgi:hypothetical protein
MKGFQATKNHLELKNMNFLTFLWVTFAFLAPDPHTQWSPDPDPDTGQWHTYQGVQ